MPVVSLPRKKSAAQKPPKKRKIVPIAVTINLGHQWAARFAANNTSQILIFPQKGDTA